MLKQMYTRESGSCLGGKFAATTRAWCLLLWVRIQSRAWIFCTFFIT